MPVGACSTLGYKKEPEKECNLNDGVKTRRPKAGEHVGGWDRTERKEGFPKSERTNLPKQ